jgi:integral membrane sensor domain MASE1
MRAKWAGALGILIAVPVIAANTRFVPALFVLVAIPVYLAVRFGRLSSTLAVVLAPIAMALFRVADVVSEKDAFRSHDERIAPIYILGTLSAALLAALAARYQGRSAMRRQTPRDST